MFDFAWSEVALIAVVALVVIGPKDLPRVLRSVGKWVNQARAIAREFQGSLDQMIREAELEEVRREIKKATEVDLEKEFKSTVDPTGELAEAVKPPELPDLTVAPPELVPPRRVANGVDRTRLALVLAVLGRHAGVSLGSSDVFVSVAGGVRVEEPGADLAIALAVASAARGLELGRSGKPLGAFGELGLTGELRHVAHAERRMAEAAKFGLAPVLAPGDGAASLKAALKAALPGRIAQAA
jgi:Tat protein translocase TatB subunit